MFFFVEKNVKKNENNKHIVSGQYYEVCFFSQVIFVFLFCGGNRSHFFFYSSTFNHFWLPSLGGEKKKHIFFFNRIESMIQNISIMVQNISQHRYQLVNVTYKKNYLSASVSQKQLLQAVRSCLTSMTFLFVFMT